MPAFETIRYDDESGRLLEVWSCLAPNHLVAIEQLIQGLHMLEFPCDSAPVELVVREMDDESECGCVKVVYQVDVTCVNNQIHITVDGAHFAIPPSKEEAARYVW